MQNAHSSKNCHLKPKPINFDKLWTRLHSRIVCVMKAQDCVPKISRMEMFEDVYAASVANPPHYQALYKRLTEYLTSHVLELKEEIVQGNLIVEYDAKWKVYKIGADCLNHIFSYFNNNYVRKNKQKANSDPFMANMANSKQPPLLEIYDLCLVKWREHLFDAIRERLLKDILMEIENDRNGKLVNYSAAQGVIDSFVHINPPDEVPMQLYTSVFEDVFLKETAEYYKNESKLFVADNKFSSYMKKATQRLEEEELRTRKFIDPNSYNKLMKVCEKQLIENHQSLFQTEIVGYFVREDIDDLSRLYCLVKRVPAMIDPLCETIQQYLSTKGLFDDVKRLLASVDFTPKLYVELLLSLHAKFSSFCLKAFDNDSSFVAALDRAFGIVINTPSEQKDGKASELIAKYCDSLLKKANKHTSSNELEEKLTNVITAFKYVEDKDVFQKFYSRMLAKRLIHDNSISHEAEVQMISLLKQSCGYEYTTKLQRMYTDIELSEKMKVSFKNHLIETNVHTKQDINILVLGSGAWPITAQNFEFKNHQVIEEMQSRFKAFYSSQHTGRKLQWLPHMSKCHLQMNYLKRRYEVQVTHYQMSVLVMFNDSDTVNKDDVETETLLEGKQLNNVLNSLVSAKLITKSPENPNSFCLNKTFSRKKGGVKFKIPANVSASDSTQEEANVTRDLIIADRKIMVQATIVRIMKARKNASHKNLVSEVIAQTTLKFKPSVSLIKKCIESLIDGLYIKRTDGSRDVYEYIS